MRSSLRKAGGVLAFGALAVSLPTVLAASPASAAPSDIRITEVAPWASGDSPLGDDWFELTNTGSTAVDITGWRVDDNSDSVGSAVPLSGVTVLQAGESAIFVTETSASPASAFSTIWFGGSAPSGLQFGWANGSGLGLGTGGDEVNIFDAGGVKITGVGFGASDSTSPFQTFDNSAGADNVTLSTVSQVGVNGAFLASDGHGVGSPGLASGGSTPTTSTPATTTTAPPSGPTFLPWPGASTVQNGSAYAFGGDMSGLDYEGTGSAVPGVLWAVHNGDGKLFRLLFDGTNWVPDPANDWGAGKQLRYPNGTGVPDAEGLTFVGEDASGGIYVSTERNNASSGTSRNAILRFDVSATGGTLNATHEWNITGDIPSTGANLGLEAITWIDDSYLVAQGFFDESKGHAYNPAEYANHGAGLFFVGVEATGTIYAYALDHTGGTFTKIATIASGFPTIMDLQFDRDLKDLWAECDNTCNGRTTVLRINPSTGKFEVAVGFKKPTGLPNANNEGFAIAPATYCDGGVKPVFWADDDETGGVAIRTGTLPCTTVEPPTPVVPEFPIAALPAATVLVLFGGWMFARRRRAAINVG